jgi:hypothetical protein
MTPFTIPRNGVEKVLTVLKGSRSAWKDVEYQAPQISAENITLDIQWLGVDNVVNYLNTILKRAGQDYWADAIPGDGEENAGIFNPDKFKLDVANLAASGLKISELTELIDQEQQAHNEFISTEGLRMLTSGNPDLMAQATKTIEDRTSKINGLRAQREARSTRRSKEVATETVRPE